MSDVESAANGSGWGNITSTKTTGNDQTYLFFNGTCLHSERHMKHKLRNCYCIRYH